MQSQTRSDIGSRFGCRESFGPQGALLSSQRLAGQASQRRLFAPRKIFTFHGSRRKTNVSTRTDDLSLGNSVRAPANTSRRRRLTPRPPQPVAVRPAPAVDACAGPPAQPSVADFAVPLAQPPALLAQQLVVGPQPSVGSTAAPRLSDEDGAKAARAWMTERPFSAREAYLTGRRRRARRQRRPKPATARPFRKIFYSERDNKWIEHRIFESEPKTTNELGGPQPFPATRRRRRPELGAPHKVKGRKTSKMREMLPTAFVKGGDKPDQPCRKIDVTDQLRMELYKRNMPVVPTYYQEHIFKFGKPPFRGNPRTH